MKVHTVRHYPVHCCCTPGKRLGYVRAPEGANSVVFPLKPTSWADDTPFETVTLRLRRLYLGQGEHIMAFDSNHQDLETLRRIPGWVDSKPVDWSGSTSNHLGSYHGKAKD